MFDALMVHLQNEIPITHFSYLLHTYTSQKGYLQYVGVLLLLYNKYPNSARSP